MRRTSNVLRLLLVPLMALVLVLAACGNAPTEEAAPQEEQAEKTPDANQPEDEANEPTESVEVHVASLKGPTSIGLVSFMDKADSDELANDYDFTIATAADEILPGVIKGDVDIALVPANVASVLYNKTEGGVAVVNINTLGVLNVVTGDEELAAAEAVTLADLAGRTVYLTGKGAVPEYTMDYLLNSAGIADSVSLEFKDEPAEVVGVLAQDPSAIGVLPQPFATAATTKNDALKVVLDLTQAWDEVATDGSQLVTGVTLVRRAFLDEHPEAVAEFMAGQVASVDAANADPAAIAPLVVEAGIIDSEPIAAKAIPSCNLVCVEGEAMRTALAGYLDALFGLDPSSVGGALPADDFYYVGA